MDLQINGFSQIMTDNDSQYFRMLQGVIEGLDEFASLQVDKTPQDTKFKLIPSSSAYSQELIYQLTEMHNLFGIHLNFSKSMKVNGTIMFSID